MIKNVILDLGGVVVLPHCGDWFSTPRFEEVIGETRLKAVSPELLSKAKAASAKIYLDESLMLPDEEYEFAVRRNYFLDLAKRLSWTITDREADVLARDMTENDARYDFYPEARETVRLLSERYTMGILSDAMPSIKRIMGNAGYLEMFDAMAISCEIGAIKPDARMYAAITELLEAEPQQCVFIDDKISNVAGAEEFGMHAIHMARNGETEWPGVRAGDLMEVYRLLESGIF